MLGADDTSLAYIAARQHLSIVPLLGDAKELRKRVSNTANVTQHLGRLERKRRLVQLPVLNLTPLHHVCLKEDGLQQPAQCGRCDAATREHCV